MQDNVAILQFFPEDKRTDSAELTHKWVGKALSEPRTCQNSVCTADKMLYPYLCDSPFSLIRWMTGDCLTQIIENTITWSEILPSSHLNKYRQISSLYYRPKPISGVTLAFLSSISYQICYPWTLISLVMKTNKGMCNATRKLLAPLISHI
jgi:hypothetical protein